MKKLVSVLALFGSMGTLVCCVLPATFVALGFGATFAVFIGRFPQLIWFSEHKPIVFGGAALLLISGALLHRRQTCPTEGCSVLKGWSHRLLILSLGLYIIGLTVAFW